MSSGVKVGFSTAEVRKFRNWVRKQKAETKRECQVSVLKNTFNLARRAMVSAPVDTGRLRSSIGFMFSHDKLGGMAYVRVNYAPYQEFGTGKYARIGILPGYESYARQFKGKGIRKVNVYPRMYFFPHYERVKKEFIKDLNRLGYR